MTSERRLAAPDAERDLPYHVVYAALGAFLGVGSPLGALMLRWAQALPAAFPPWARAELAANALFYLYMGVGSVTAFVAFGWHVGSHVEHHRVRSRELRRRVEELHLRSVVDGLTGAYSHAYLQEVLALEMEAARRGRRPLSILMLDLDDFKQLNDGHGHLFGDRVLKELTETASMNIRREDVLGRYGGEEFLVIMPGADGEVALAIAERVRRAFARAGITPARAARGRVRVTVSIGAATFEGEPGVDARSLIARADANLYAAKRAGKNKVVAD